VRYFHSFLLLNLLGEKTLVGGFPTGSRRVARAVHDTADTRSAFKYGESENARIGPHRISVL
jgi:hypothetical protein